MRRKIIEAEKSAPDLARILIEGVRALYAVEKRASGLAAADRLDLRQKESKPALAALRQQFLTAKEQLLPKHPMAEAIGYALNQWDALQVFCEDGAVPIDNNVSEREMKCVVLNRKNSLFVGNPRGGRTAAILASFTSTCRRHDITHNSTSLSCWSTCQPPNWASCLPGCRTNGSYFRLHEMPAQNTNPKTAMRFT